MTLCSCAADTHALEEIDAGLIPEWKDKTVPEVAKYYWKMGPVSRPFPSVWTRINL